MQAYVEGPAPAYQKSANYQVNVASAWKEFLVPFEVAGAQPTGSLGFKFAFGATGRPQILEFGGVEAYWYGKSRPLSDLPRTSFDYVGREQMERVIEFHKEGYNCAESVLKAFNEDT